MNRLLNQAYPTYVRAFVCELTLARVRCAQSSVCVRIDRQTDTYTDADGAVLKNGKIDREKRLRRRLY